MPLNAASESVAADARNGISLPANLSSRIRSVLAMQGSAGDPRRIGYEEDNNCLLPPCARPCSCIRHGGRLQWTEYRWMPGERPVRPGPVMPGTGHVPEEQPDRFWYSMSGRDLPEGTTREPSWSGRSEYNGGDLPDQFLREPPADQDHETPAGWVLWWVEKGNSMRNPGEFISPPLLL